MAIQTLNPNQASRDSVTEQAGFVRLYNTHPTQAFRFGHDSRIYVFQPKSNGTWAVKRTTEPAGRKQNKSRVVTELVKVSDEQPENYLLVPYDLAKKIVHGDPSGLNDRGEIDESHHGGAIKRFESVEREVKRELQAKQEAVAAKERRLAELEAEIAALEEAKATAKIQAAVAKTTEEKPKATKTQAAAPAGDKAPSNG